MLPNRQPQMVPGGAPSPAPQAEGQQIGPDQAREALLNVLTKAKQLADKYSLDLTELVSEVMKGGGAVPPAPTRVSQPAKAPMPGPPAPVV